MDHIDYVLTSFSLDPKYCLAIRAAVGTAKKTLNCYYELTDSSESYRIAMSMSFSLQCPQYAANIHLFSVLHPQHKLKYFKNARWEVEWINTAENLVHDEFDRSYARSDSDSDDGLYEEVKTVSNKVCLT